MLISRVYLARADVFADAVAAGTRSRAPGPSCGEVPAAVTETLSRLAPDTVVALGGEQAVCDDLLAAAAGQQPPGGQPDALAATVQRIRDEVLAPSGLSGAVTCPDVPVLRRGDVHECLVEPDDNNAAEAAVMYVIVRDDEGGMTFEYGNAALYTLDDFAAEGFGPDTLCGDLAADGSVYFYAVLYWFAGEPERMDADLNGIPCETVYPAEAVNGFWTGAPLGSYERGPG